MLYFDTSALLPYYRQEAASARIQRLLSAQREPVAISRLTVVEVASALARWVRTGDLTEAQANRIENAFLEDINAARLRVLSLATAHFERAFHWLLTRKTSLRTLDALHLACAEANGMTLVTLDNAMRQAAVFLGLRVH